jgi:hypothetical protein
MKYIKRFNEELKPETYISAGYRLKNLPGGGKKRSSPLIDYGFGKGGNNGLYFQIGEAF